jgi:hypothetical protein
MAVVACEGAAHRRAASVTDTRARKVLLSIAGSALCVAVVIFARPHCGEGLVGLQAAAERVSLLAAADAHPTGGDRSQTVHSLASRISVSGAHPVGAATHGAEGTAAKNAPSVQARKGQEQNAAAARAALAQKRLAEKAVRAADKDASAVAAVVAHPAATGSAAVPAHCLRFAMDKNRVVHAPRACLRWSMVRQVTAQAQTEGVSFVWIK